MPKRDDDEKNARRTTKLPWRDYGPSDSERRLSRRIGDPDTPSDPARRSAPQFVRRNHRFRKPLDASAGGAFRRKNRSVMQAVIVDGRADVAGSSASLIARNGVGDQLRIARRTGRPIAVGDSCDAAVAASSTRRGCVGRRVRMQKRLGVRRLLVRGLLVKPRPRWASRRRRTASADAGASAAIGVVPFPAAAYVVDAPRSSRPCGPRLAVALLASASRRVALRTTDLVTPRATAVFRSSSS